MRLESSRTDRPHHTTTLRGQLPGTLSEIPRSGADNQQNTTPEDAAAQIPSSSREASSRLDQLESLARHGEPEELLALARPELHRLTEGLRALLDEHRPDGQGRCRTCPGGLRARRWPCGVWSTVYTELVGDDLDELGDSTRKTSGRTGRRSLHDSLRAERVTDGPRAEVPVVTEPIVSGGTHDPGHWDTGELEALPTETGRTAGETPEETPSVPPLGGHLETDHTRIHRAEVSDRTKGHRK